MLRNSVDYIISNLFYFFTMQNVCIFEVSNHFEMALKIHALFKLSNIKFVSIIMKWIGSEMINSSQHGYVITSTIKCEMELLIH